MKLPIILPPLGNLVDLRKVFTIFGAGWHRTVAESQMVKTDINIPLFYLWWALKK